MATTRTERHSSGFGSFFFALLLTLIAAGGAVLWFGSRQPAQVAQVERPHLSIPLPEVPPPPGVIPRS